MIKPPSVPKVVLDTNVIVSAFLKPESNPVLILSLFSEDYLTICLSQEILVEYRKGKSLETSTRKASTSFFL